MLRLPSHQSILMRVTDQSQILAQLMSTQAAFQLYKCLGLIKALMALQSERGILLSHAHLVGRTHTTVNVLQQGFCCACWLYCSQPNSLKDCNPCTLNCHCCRQPWDWWWYVVAVALVAVARLRHLVSVSRMCLKLMWATRTTAILCEQSNNGLSAGNSNGHTGFIWSCEKVVGQRWGKVPVILAFCTVCNLWNIFSKASSLNDCLKVLSEDTLGENVSQVARSGKIKITGSNELPEVMDEAPEPAA